MLVKNKVFVVTGAGNGIGRELTLHLLSRGARVAAVDRNESYLAETVRLARSRKSRLSMYVINVADRPSVEALPARIIADHGHVDGIINNAGIIQPFVRLQDLSYEDIENVLDVNLMGSLYMVKAFLPHLLARPVAHITNIASMGGFLPVPGQTMYGASKAGLKLMTEGLYAELINTNVRVTVVYPGAIGTNIAGNSGLELQLPEDGAQASFKMTSPREAARIIVEAIEKDRYSVTIGSDARLMDFLYRLSPRLATGLISRQMKSLLPG